MAKEIDEHNIELSCHPETEPHAKLLQVNDQSVTPHLGDSSNDSLDGSLPQTSEAVLSKADPWQLVLNFHLTVFY